MKTHDQMKDEKSDESKITKVVWKGKLLSVQPRIRLVRSFDQRCKSGAGRDGPVDDAEHRYRLFDGENLPTEFTLAQNNSNPFNPATVNSYHLP